MLSAAERRCRLGRREDAVRAVAVVALGRARYPGSGHLAVVRIEERLRFLLVAPSALAHHQHAEVVTVRAADRVRRVTILARRVAVIAPVVGEVTVLRPVNALAELLFDPVVTLAAGPGDVVRVDLRGGFGGRQLRVRPVTVRAGRRDHEAALEQSLAVDAHLVALDDIRAVALNPPRRRLPRHVAPGAQLRDVARVDR